MDDKAVLKPLADKIEALAARPGEEDKKQLWARHQALQKTGRIPVCVYYEGIPGPQWDLMLGKGHLKCATATGREIELCLRKVIWMAENVPDDHIVWPVMRLTVPHRVVRGWGVALEMIAAHEELGAKAFAAPFKDAIDPGRLTEPVWEVDEKAWAAKQEEALALTGGKLDIHAFYDNLAFAPFDVVANMCGLESAMMFAVDQPEALHGLMDFITSAVERHHLNREKRGWINYAPDRSGKYQIMPVHRVHCAFLPGEYRGEGKKPLLKYEWPYITAQTSSGYGPDMYEEFVHRYNCRLARHFPLKTVYYHGCEPLDQKIVHLKDLPNLRRFHVSPWSSVSRAVEVLKGSAVMEVHSHPGKVFFGWTEKDMRKNIRDLIASAQGHPMDLNLSDIHSVNGNPETLALWARIAREEVEK